MTDSTQENLGRLDDDQEAAEPSSDEGTAAAGEYDPAQGSPGTAHPTDDDVPGGDLDPPD
jgi:hypothetical protein